MIASHILVNAYNLILFWGRYIGDAAETERGDKAWSDLPSLEQCSTQEKRDGHCSTVLDALTQSRSALEPLLDKYDVDIYIAGHVHVRHHDGFD